MTTATASEPELDPALALIRIGSITDTWREFLALPAPSFVGAP